MSSDDYFDGEWDSAFVQEVEAIEAAECDSAKQHNVQSTPAIQPPNPLPAKHSAQGHPSSDEFDMTFDVDESELAKLDNFIADSYAGMARPVASTSKLTRQTTLYGETLPEPPPKSQKTRTIQRAKSSSRNCFGNKAPKTKKWDHTEFAKSGWKKSKGKGKEKEKQKRTGEEERDEMDLEFEQFPDPEPAHQIPVGPPPPMKLKPDLLAAKDWIFPLNNPRRDYQFNIVRQCLFENTLVALPTGLGKTFIAGVVMLNYYKWFPEGKVIFVAPTKPLVAQQIKACHQACGIPGSDAAELTGQNPKQHRLRAWGEKRVFYMTPQTLLNDLINKCCDPQDVILLVIDEAHKGTGDYSYAQVVRYMMAYNPHFRILALTATPGSTPEAVQNIVDSLHISHIEIRDEQCMDLRPYLFKKEINLHVIKMTDAILKIREPLVKLMEGYANRLKSCGLLHCDDVVQLHPYSCQTASKAVSCRPDCRQLAWAFPQLKVLGTLARVMSYLMEFSIGMCHRMLQDLTQGGDRENSTAPSKQQLSSLRSNSNYVKLMQETNRQHKEGFTVHPKMEMLLSLAKSHFAMANGDADDSKGLQTRVMVFVSFRECVDEIVDSLNRHRPLIRAAKFIGQGTDKQGRKGIAQTEQLKVIEDFKNGVYNLLVSTSVGEEGLDIGEIDRIICYDAQKTPIRMLQRVGRTGRKRTGFVEVLLAEDREERNWAKSLEKYERVQRSIGRGDQLELFGDVDRLLPDHIKPRCLQTVMEIEEYVREKETRKEKTGRLPQTKKKRDDDIHRNIPLGAISGFVSAKDLSVKAPKKRQKKLKEFDIRAIEDDETDIEIERGLRSTRKPVSHTMEASSAKEKKLKVPRKRKTVKKPLVPLSASQLGRYVEDDSDDMVIEQGPLVPQISLARQTSPVHEVSTASTSGVYDADKVICLSSPTSSLRISTHGSVPKCLSYFEMPEENQNRIPSQCPRLHDSPHDSPDKHYAPQAHVGDSSEWLIDAGYDSDSDRQGEFGSLPHDILEAKRKIAKHSQGFRTVRSLNSNDGFQASPISHLPPAKAANHARRNDVPLPSTSSHSGIGTNASSPPYPESSFPVQDTIIRRKRRANPAVQSLSSPLDMPLSSQRRLKRQRESPSPSPVRKGKKKNCLDGHQHNSWFDLEAVHSGDEESEGSSEVDVVETGGDRRFIQDISDTQVSPSYNQSAAYRLGLMTQVPVGAAGPAFAHKPKRTGPFAGGRHSPKPIVAHSSPNLANSGFEEYHMGSFVVKDEDTMHYDSASSEL